MKIYAKSTLRDDFGNLKMDFPKNWFGLVPAIVPSQLKINFPESSEWGGHQNVHFSKTSCHFAIPGFYVFLQIHEKLTEFLQRNERTQTAWKSPDGEDGCETERVSVSSSGADDAFCWEKLAVEIMGTPVWAVRSPNEDQRP